MKKVYVKCPKCNRLIHTSKKEEFQCRECGLRYEVKENMIKI